MDGARNRFEAVLFDFDGTLADSFGAITASVNHVRHNHGLAPLSIDEVKPHVGWGPEHLLSQTVPQGDPRVDGKLYREHHPGVMHDQTHLLPGCCTLLDHLRRLRVRLALCSNKPVQFTRELLKSLRIIEYFDHVLGPELVARAKPAPDMLLHALERLGAQKSQALYVGDMTNDITTARAAGIEVWVVATGSQSREQLRAAQPDRVFDDLEQIAAFWDPPALDSPARRV